MKKKTIKPSKQKKRIKKKEKINESLQMLSKKLSTINNIDKFFKKNFGHLFSALFIIKENKFLEFKVGHDWGIAPGKQFNILKCGVIGWAAKMKDELLIENVTKDKRKLEGNGKIKSIYAAPLLWGKDVVGVLAFGLKQQKKWDESDFSIFRSLNWLIAAAISNAIFPTELKEYSKKIDNLNQFINSIINGFPSGILIIDKKGNITLINEKAQEVLGFSEDDAKKITIKELFDYKRATVNPFLKTITEKRSLTRVETNIVEKDGKQIPVGFSTSPLRDESGKIIGAIGVMRELTQIKQMEKRLRRQDRLVALGEMSAGMAHEIRNPLAGIKTGVEYLGMFLDDEQKDSVTMIVKEITRLNRIVTDMTSYANRPPMNWEEEDIKDIINMSLAFLKYEIEEKHIEVIKNFDKKVPNLKLDRYQIREVFDNIILNAIQASKNNGKIKISTHLLSKEKRIEIKVSDTGVGISKENRERIFNPFFTTKNGGTGLGLSICHRIITEHNGYISIPGNQEKGTTMRIVLPIKP